MAITKCKECGGLVSTKAEACPQCGAKSAKKTSMFAWLMTGAVALVVGSCIVGGDGAKRSAETAKVAAAAVEAAKSPEQREAEMKAKAKQEAEFQFAVTATKVLRSSLKDPASFELVKAVLIDGGALCLEYRGKNSFNAFTTERAAISRAMKTADWNKACGGKTGENMDRVKYAL